jgi:fumarylacetoacetate (FAA) hydrolase
MRLATRHNGAPDGELVIVSADGARCVAVTGFANLLYVLENWEAAQPALKVSNQSLVAGEGEALDPATLRAPLPRSWQWLDGSAFPNHGDLMQIAFGLDPIDSVRPLMYQGMSDRFYGPNDPIPFSDESGGIDFEGEFGVIVDAVPMGISAADAADHIRLIVQINDWSLRAIAPVEMKTGFGWVQAKPACSMAPFAVTPDELGAGWRDGRVCLDLEVMWNGERFGLVNGEQMAFSLPELIAHAARTRDLVAGTIIGTGTVSNVEYGTRGSACISERRAIEIIADGAPSTNFMDFDDTVRMEARGIEGNALFGAIDQTVVRV